MEKVSKFILSVLLYLAFFVALSLLLPQIESVFYKVLLVISYTGVVTLLNIYLLRSELSIGQFYEFDLKHIVVAVVSALLISILPAWLVHGAIGFHAENLLSNFISQLNIAYSEESFFRVFIFLYLLRYTQNFLLAALVTSALFSLIHIQVYSYSQHWYVHIGIFCFSMVCCYVMAYVRSLWPCVAGHFVLNFCAAVLTEGNDVYVYDPADVISAWLWLALTGSLLVAKRKQVLAKTSFIRVFQ